MKASRSRGWHVPESSKGVVNFQQTAMGAVLPTPSILPASGGREPPDSDLDSFEYCPEWGAGWLGGAPFAFKYD